MTGNDVEYTYGTSGNETGRRSDSFETGRFLFWTEDCYGCEHRLCQSNVVSNRMHAAVDEKYSSYYAYDHSGERRLKLTGMNDLMDVNADYMYTASIMKEPTLYPSAYMVMSNKGYTNVVEVESRASSLVLPRCSNVTERKHYYAGTERVAARIGGGGLNVIDSDQKLSDSASVVFRQSLKQINDRHLDDNNIDCIVNGLYSNDKLLIDVNEAPERLKAMLRIDYSEFWRINADVQNIHHNEPDVYFYHSDHLGSASWITDTGGLAVQHLQYLPYGERYVDQRAAGYHERFTFTGKERDEETGYGYFGARYMDHELMTMWLSVDPMADKYPSMSPYSYCAWNPVKLVDPDGREIWIKGSDGNEYQYKGGKLLNADGSDYKGEDEFVLRVMNDLNTLKINGMEDQISSLEKSGYKHRIESTDGHNQTKPESDAKATNGTGCKTTIKYNQNRLKEDGWKRPAVVGLAHELQHSFEMDKGIYNDEAVFYDVLTICSVWAPGAKYNEEFNLYTRMETRKAEKGEYNAVVTANLVNRNLCGENAKARTKYDGCPISKLRP